MAVARYKPHPAAGRYWPLGKRSIPLKRYYRALAAPLSTTITRGRKMIFQVGLVRIAEHLPVTDEKCQSTRCIPHIVKS